MNPNIRFFVFLSTVAVLGLPAPAPGAEVATPLREDVLFRRSTSDLRDLVIDYEQLEEAKLRKVVLVDVSMAIRPFPSLDTGEHVKRTLAMPTGKTILETLSATMEHENGRRVVDLGFLVRVFTKDRVVQFRYQQVPEDFATVMLAAGDVVLVSMR